MNEMEIAPTELRQLRWRKATGCYPYRACVEVADVSAGRVAVRDSKDPGGSVLVFGPRQWNSFLQGARAGDFS